MDFLGNIRVDPGTIPRYLVQYISNMEKYKDLRAIYLCIGSIEDSIYLLNMVHICYLGLATIFLFMYVLYVRVICMLNIL